MGNKNKFNTGVLVAAVFFLFVLVFGYLTMGDVATEWFNRPESTAQNNTNETNNKVEDLDEVVDGIHLQTGLVYAEGFDIVRGMCTACHSAKLVTQNRATREGWEQMIDWMQETQGLWDLGKAEPVILDYLAKHYAPTEVGRRANLDVTEVEWYILDLEE